MCRCSLSRLRVPLRVEGHPPSGKRAHPARRPQPYHRLLADRRRYSWRHAGKQGQCPHCSCDRHDRSRQNARYGGPRGVAGINRTAVGSCTRASHPNAGHARDPPFPHIRNHSHSPRHDRDPAAEPRLESPRRFPRKRLIHIDPQFGKVIGMMLRECFDFEMCPHRPHQSSSPPCGDFDLIYGAHVGF